jgi:xylulokinase
MALFLGIDTSTTATKALLVDERGKVVAVASNPHPLSTPRPLWSEQDPHDWWNATQLSIRQALEQAGVRPGDVASVGLTGQMHGLVLLDEQGEVLRPAILWNDGRASAECEWMRVKLGLDRLVELTGNNAFEGFTAPKLLWVKNHEPEVYSRVRQILLPKDYIRYMLTGAYATDRAGAGGTLMLDLRTRDWSPEILQLCEVPLDWLPPTHEGPEVTGDVSREGAALTGLAEGTPVVGGGGDQAAGAVGVGAVRPGVMSLAMGTSGVVFAPSETPAVAPQGRAHSFPHAVPGRWHMMGVMLSAAGSLNWYRQTFAPEVAFETLLSEAESVDRGSENLFFLPYLSGERTPHANPLATGSFFGFTLRHGRGHATRAVLEGVAFGLRDNLQLLLDAGIPHPDEMRVSGGGARSALWRQILADTLNVPLRSVQTTEGAAFGAALLAGVAAGAWPDVESACDAAVLTGETTMPDPAGVRFYADAYHRFTSIYPTVAPLYRSLIPPQEMDAA